MQTRSIGLMVVLVVAVSAIGISAVSGDDLELRPRLVAADVAKTPRHRPPPSCYAGRVAVGKEGGVIRFSVTCDTRQRAKVARFSLTRYALDGSRAKSGIIALQGTPMVESGRNTGQANCELVREAVSCQARAQGVFKVQGAFLVAPGRECALGVALTVVKPSECGPGLCEGTLTLKYLAKGRPVGCA